DIFTLDIPQSRSWSDDDLFEFCAANKELKIERDEHGYIIVMSPSGGFSSHYIFIILLELGNWNRKSPKGMIFESSGGFLLKDGSMRAPDVSFVAQEKWKALTDKEKRQFPPICPDFVVEVRSESDRLTILQNKMQTWIQNGSQLAWLIDPLEQNFHIYRPNREVELIESFEHQLSGEDVLPDFTFDLHLLLTS
ncbi:MAG: Uma2 family endonuclease, partial [Bacteroidota bacterium]